MKYVYKTCLYVCFHVYICIVSMFIHMLYMFMLFYIYMFYMYIKRMYINLIKVNLDIVIQITVYTIQIGLKYLYITI